jgi:anti-sigma factor RsiW
MMMHPSEETLVAYCSGDATPSEIETVEQHLAGCSACRDVCAETGRLFETMARVPVPERDPNYGAQVWERLEPKLPRERHAHGITRVWYQRASRTWLAAAALLIAVLGSFFVGRWTSPEPDTSEANALARERILLAIVADHLDRSSRALVEVANADPRTAVFLEEEKRVRELLAVNRLLRQSAGDGDPVVQALLDDLERTLIEIAHASTGTDANELGAIQERLEARGLLFKMRIASAQLRGRAFGTRRPERQTI